MDHFHKYNKYKNKYLSLKGGKDTFDNQPMLILGVCGSSKHELSKNMMMLKYCEKLLKKYVNVTFQIIDIINLPCSGDYHGGLPTKELKNITDLYNKCDGILFLSPTYNWGITATLKNFIDWMPIYKSNQVKPCAIMGAAGSKLSLQSNLQLRQIGVEMNYLFINKLFIGINIWGGKDKFDDKFVPSQRTEENIDKLLKNLITLIIKLRSGTDFV